MIDLKKLRKMLNKIVIQFQIIKRNNQSSACTTHLSVNSNWLALPRVSIVDLDVATTLGGLTKD